MCPCYKRNKQCKISACNIKKMLFDLALFGFMAYQPL